MHGGLKTRKMCKYFHLNASFAFFCCELELLGGCCRVVCSLPSKRRAEKGRMTTCLMLLPHTLALSLMSQTAGQKNGSTRVCFQDFVVSILNKQDEESSGRLLSIFLSISASTAHEDKKSSERLLFSSSPFLSVGPMRMRNPVKDCFFLLLHFYQ